MHKIIDTTLFKTQMLTISVPFASQKLLHMVLLTLFDLAQGVSMSIYSQLANSGCGGICISGQNAPIIPDVSLAQVFGFDTHCLESNNWTSARFYSAGAKPREESYGSIESVTDSCTGHHNKMLSYLKEWINSGCWIILLKHYKIPFLHVW